MAVSADGRILGFQSFIVRDGGLKAADWRLFLQLLIPKLGVYVPGHPWHLQASNCVVMFDNAPIHTVGGDTFLANNGVPILRLPAYSPDLQPIEGLFNDLKVIIRNLVYVQPDLLDNPHLLQARAASFITRRDPIWHPMEMHFLSAGYEHHLPPTTTAHVDQWPQMSSKLPHSTDDTHFVAQPRRVPSCSVISGPFTVRVQASASGRISLGL